MLLFRLAIDDPGDLGTAQPDIGERMRIERQQLGLGLVPPPPFREGALGRNEKVRERHGSLRKCNLTDDALHQLTLRRKNQ
jgi:hypothetical protein